MRRLLALLAVSVICSAVSCRSAPPAQVHSLQHDPELITLLQSTPRLASIFASAPEHRLQLLVSEVIRGSRPRLERRGFRVDAEYFYPASAIKTCAAVAACEELNRYSREHAAPFDLETAMSFDALFEDEKFENRDLSNLDGGQITIGHEIRKLFLVSDNRAFNRLYEFAGQKSLNERMWAAGLRSVRVRHRLSEFRSFEEQKRTPAIALDRSAFHLDIPLRTSTLPLPPEDLPGTFAGEAYATNHDPPRRVEEPFDFRFKNRISLTDLQDLHVLILRPELFPDHVGFDLTEQQRTFLARAMRQLPRESVNPKYDPEDYPDEYVRYLLPGLRRVVPADSVFVYDKVGRAYGFTVENAYVVGEDGRAFFITAVLYTNPNATLNDGIYDYERVADPFFADLGQALAERYLTE